MNRFLYPILGLLIAAATVAQVKATRAPRETKPALSADASVPLVVAEGRVVSYPGAEVVVGTDVQGTIERLAVDEKDVVRRGDLIAVIRADDTRAALSVARARIAEADADIRLAQAEVDRARSLWEEEVGTKQAWDRAVRDLDAARSRRESAAAEVRRLDALVEKTVIRAPIDGVVISREAEPGETVPAGAKLVAIADLKRTRIEAEVDEFDTARMRLGLPVRITAEGFDEQWPGTIEEIPDTVVNRRIKPQDPSKPIDTRVLLVKVALDETTPLKLGQRVEVRIEGR